MSNLHPTFEAILKPHLQGQRVVRRRDLERYKALSAVHAELELAGVTIDISQLDCAVSEVQNRLHEASLDRQYAYEQSRKESPEPTGQDFDEPCEYCGQDGHQGGCRAHERHDRRCL